MVGARMLPAVVTVLQLVLLSVLVAAVVEVPIAWVNRRLILREVRAGEARVLAKVEALQQPAPAALMRGGHDPVAMAEAKAAKAEERRIEAVATEVEVKTFLAERFGVERVAQVEAFLGDEVMAGVYSAGKRWKPLLSPLLKKLPAKAADPAAAPMTPFEAHYG